MFDYSSSPYPVRGDIAAAHRAYWRTLARPGSWWTGAERVAIAAESRNASRCGLCAARKAALTPAAVADEHAGSNELPDVAVDAIHRIVTDPGRMTKRYVQGNAA